MFWSLPIFTAALGAAILKRGLFRRALACDGEDCWCSDGGPADVLYAGFGAPSGGPEPSSAGNPAVERGPGGGAAACEPGSGGPGGGAAACEPGSVGFETDSESLGSGGPRDESERSESDSGSDCDSECAIWGGAEPFAIVRDAPGGQVTAAVPGAWFSASEHTDPAHVALAVVTAMLRMPRLVVRYECEAEARAVIDRIIGEVCEILVVPEPGSGERYCGTEVQGRPE